MKNQALGKSFISLIAAAWMLSAAPVRGNVDVTFDTLFNNNGFDFDPLTAVIQPGDTVTWWNADYMNDLHVTFDNGAYFDLPNDYYAPIKLPWGPGTYGYSDQFGGRATVVIAVPPTITVTSTTNFSAPATFIFQVDATESAGDFVSDVQFYLGTVDPANLVADISTAPYSVGFTNLDAGTYTLIVVATDAYGFTSTNTITFTVTAQAVVNLGAPRIATNKFLFDVTGLTVGKTNIVQLSTNLVSWTPVKTNIAASAAMTVTNSAGSPRQFFRIVQLP